VSRVRRGAAGQDPCTKDFNTDVPKRGSCDGTPLGCHSNGTWSRNGIFARDDKIMAEVVARRAQRVRPAVRGFPGDVGPRVQSANPIQRRVRPFSKSHIRAPSHRGTILSE
jgi:hypothetical protein